MYSTGNDYSSEDTGMPVDDAANLLKAMEELFFIYHVDLFIVGHVHVRITGVLASTISCSFE